jgi:hypothetical protein
VCSTNEVSEFDSRQEKRFSLLHSVETGSGAHPSFCTRGTEASYPGREATGASDSQLTTYAVEFNNARSYTSIFLYTFMVWSLIKHRDNFAFFIENSPLPWKDD